jgi:hypothetical protein
MAWRQLTPQQWEAIRVHLPVIPVNAIARLLLDFVLPYSTQ